MSTSRAPDPVDQTLEYYLARRRPPALALYLALIGLVLTVSAALPLLHVDVYVRASGIVRPTTEKHEVRAGVGALVERAWVSTGEAVQKGAVLVTLNSGEADARGRLAAAEGQEHVARQADLLRLTGLSERSGPAPIDLFAGSVLENIVPGIAEPDMERVLALCQLLGIMDLIEGLPQGFGTVLGENGAGLSGGERQRLAIARALYRDPALLILDEPTASLDPVSEEYVQRAIEDLKARGRTVLIITHRMSMVARADHVVVLQGGRVVEEGPPAQLLERGGALVALHGSEPPLPAEVCAA